MERGWFLRYKREREKKQIGKKGGQDEKMMKGFIAAVLSAAVGLCEAFL